MKINIKNPVILDLVETGIEKTADDEIFVQLPFNDKYFISTYGRLFSKYRGKLLEPQLYGSQKIKNNLYHTFKLQDSNGKGKNYRAHKLVAVVFVENPDPVNKNCVHHKNKDHLDNYYKNLQWVSNDEHKFLHTGRKIYYYDVNDGSLTNFTTIQSLCDYLDIDKRLIRNAIYHSKAKFTLENGIDVFKVKGMTRNGQPIYIAVEDTAEVKIGIGEGIVLGGLLLLGGWVWLKEKLKTYRK